MVKEKWWDFVIKFNYMADIHPWRMVVIFIIPIFTIAILAIANIINPLFYLVVAPWFIFLYFARSMHPFDKLKYHSGEDVEKINRLKNFYSNRWFKRGVNQFILIDPIDNYWLKLYVHSLQQPWKSPYAKDENWDPDSMHKSYWGEWNMTTAIPATQQEIEKYKLELLEVKMLLIKDISTVR